MPSLYVHVPFCQKKCAYCAFFSVPATEYIPGYLQELAREIEGRPLEAPEGVSSLFIGGGTPSILSAGELDTLLGLLHKRYNFSAGSEKTIEVNPGSLDREKLRVMQNYGINRISLGAQSFQDRLLQAIGRVHRQKDIITGAELIRTAGLENINLDLIYGLPGQSLNDWQETLRQAVALSPCHFSIYALTLEENTPLAKRNYLPDEDLQADMYEWALEFFWKKGYDRYEISNFTRAGYECRHNISYWRGEDYIGLGPGAVSCLDGVRTKNISDLGVYLRCSQSGIRPLDDEAGEILTREQLISEYVILGLRMTEGINKKEFEAKFNRSIQDIYGEILQNYMNRNILLDINGRIRIIPAYFLVANTILTDFII